jgi:molecular chaperone DnaK (HSP70)
MPLHLGVDFGTEFLRMAESGEGVTAKSIQSPQAPRHRTPCAVSLGDRSLWGRWALEAPANLICDLRRRLSDASADPVSSSLAQTREYTARFFERLGESLPAWPDPEGRTAVAVTVPYAMGLRQRQWLHNAVEEAGLRNAALINDPEAAVLGCGLDRWLNRDRPYRVLVFDVGAYTTTCSVLEVCASGATIGIELLAYDDEAPGMRAVQARVLEGAGFDLSPGLPPAFQLDWEQLEHALAEGADGRDCTLGNRGQRLRIEARRVAKGVAEWQDQAREGVRRALDRAELGRRDIHYAIAAGGGCAVPGLDGAIGAIPRAGIAEAVGPDEVCCHGAARYAAMRAGGNPPFRSAERPAIGFEMSGGAFDRVLDINHHEAVPSSRVYMPNNEAVRTMHLVPRQGFARRAACNEPLLDEPIRVRLADERRLLKVEAVRQPDFTIKLTLRDGDPAREEVLHAK